MLKEIRKKPKQASIIILMDVVFIILILGLDRSLGVLIRETPPPNPMILFYLITYLLLAAFTYTVFKYMVLHRISNLFKRQEHNYAKIPSFFGFNLLIFILFSIFLFGIIFILQALQIPPEHEAMKFLGRLLLFLVYLKLQVLHLYFYHTGSVVKAFTHSATFIGRQYKALLKLIGANALAFITIVLALTGISKIAEPHLGSFQAITFMAVVLGMALLIGIYILNYFNRIYLYKNVKI